MAKNAGLWIESKRCIFCNPHLPKEREHEKKVGYVKDLDEKWTPCSCNNKGYITKSGTLSS